MSHARERAEKICLNCNTHLSGRFCHVCGQENTDPRESIWSVIVHFFNDITHFDGKFFRTVGLLLRKPGFLPLEYIRGRRASYLHPIRLYVFTSAVFFLVFYSVLSPSIIRNIGRRADSETSQNSPGASGRIKPGTVPSAADVALSPIDTIKAVTSREIDYKTVAEYDSAQKALPPGERDGWMEQQLKKSFIEKSIRYGGSGQSIAQSFTENFIHSFPYLLFVSLPVCALFLQLLFLGNRNNVYAGNAIFLVYLYVFTFLALLVYILLTYLKGAYQQGWLEWIKIAILLYVIYYTAKAMKTYYGQGRIATMLKFIVYNILAFFTMVALFIVFALISALKSLMHYLINEKQRDFSFKGVVSWKIQRLRRF